MKKISALLGAVLAAPAWGMDGIALEGGRSDSSRADVSLVRLAAQWDWKVRWLERAGWFLGGYWDLQIGRWINDSPDRTHAGLWDVGLTPVLRLQWAGAGGFAPYLEGGIGAHLLSETSVSRERRFGSNFQFGDHLGFGLRFGPRQAFDLSYRYQHLSNAGIKSPNNGINFHQVRFGYWF